MRRSARGRCSERVTSTSRPMSESVMPAMADDAAVLEHDRVVELGVDDLAVGGDRRERTDVAVHDLRALADDGGPRTREPMISASFSITTRPSMLDAASTEPWFAGSSSSRM